MKTLNKSNRGGKRAGAGRPSDQRTKILTEMLDGVISPEMWITLIESTYQRAIDGDQRALEWLTDRRFGKAQQQVDVTSEGQKLKTLTQIIFREVDGSIKEADKLI